MKRLFSFILFFVFIFPASAWSRWWERHDEGWFFYKEEPPVKQEQKQEQKNKKVTIPEGRKPADSLTEVDRLKKELEQTLKIAVSNPTPENVYRYIKTQQKVMQMARQFATVWQYVIMSHPEEFKTKYLTQHETERQIREVVMQLSKKAGILFIYSSKCPYCQKEAYVIKRLSEEFGFKVLPVTVDGTSLSEFPDTRINNGITYRLGVTSVPAIFLMFPETREFQPVATGFIEYYNLLQRLYFYATLKLGINTSQPGVTAFSMEGR